MTREEALKVLEEEDKKKQDDFLLEYKMLCEKYELELEPKLQMTIVRTKQRK